LITPFHAREGWERLCGWQIPLRRASLVFGREQMGKRERQASTAVTGKIQPEAMMLMEEVLRREDLVRALRRVRSSREAPGIDRMTVEELTPYLKEHWPRIGEELLEGKYEPQPVRRVENPKPSRKGVGAVRPRLLDCLRLK
jgi:hypothetical protein